MLSITNHKSCAIQIRMWYQLAPVRKDIVKKMENKGWGGCVKKENACTLLVEKKLVQPQWGTT